MAITSAAGRDGPPTPASPDRTPKRKGKRENPWEEIWRYRQATANEVDTIIQDLGFEVSDAERASFLARLNTTHLSLADVLRRIREMPPPSEIIEMMDAVSSAAKLLLRKLGVDGSATNVYPNGQVTRRMNPTINIVLAQTAGTYGPDFDLVAAAARGVACLAVLADNASADAVLQKRPRQNPDHYLSNALAVEYRHLFRRDPTLTRGGPWLRFLRWGLDLHGSGPKKGTDDALMKLPIPNIKRASARRRRETSP